MENKKVLDIIAYFLSKYNMDAFSALGYPSQRKGFIELPKHLVGKKAICVG